MNIMMYYIVYIMKGAGIGDELLTAAIQYIINVVMTLPAIIYLDKFGRRPALIIGAFLMMVWLFISGKSPPLFLNNAPQAGLQLAGDGWWEPS
jgi:MFS family permease